MGANADMVRSAWEAFGRGDVDGAVSTTADSAQIVLPAVSYTHLTLPTILRV